MGVRGPKRQPNSIHRSGWRPTAINPEFKALVDAIADCRNWPKSKVIEQALLAIATDQEKELAEYDD